MPLLPSPQNISGAIFAADPNLTFPRGKKKKAKIQKFGIVREPAYFFSGKKGEVFAVLDMGNKFGNICIFPRGGTVFHIFAPIFAKKILFCCPRPHVLVVKGKKEYVIWPKKGFFLLPAGEKKEEGLDIWEKLLCVFDVMLQPAGQKKSKKIGEM